MNLVTQLLPIGLAVISSGTIAAALSYKLGKRTTSGSVSASDAKTVFDAFEAHQVLQAKDVTELRGELKLLVADYKGVEARLQVCEKDRAVQAAWQLKWEAENAAGKLIEAARLEATTIRAENAKANAEMELQRHKALAELQATLLTANPPGGKT